MADWTSVLCLSVLRPLVLALAVVLLSAHVPVATLLTVAVIACTFPTTLSGVAGNTTGLSLV